MADPTGPPGRRRLSTVRAAYRGSWVEDLLARLAALEFGTWIISFGASLLLAVLPFIILLSSLANERIDDDLSRHLGLNGQGARVIDGLFRHKPSHSAAPIVLGLLIAFAGTLAVANTLQILYERVFSQPPRGWRGLPRLVAWVAVLFGLLIAEGSYDRPLRAAAGVIVRDLASLSLVIVFFAWTIHFLLAGRASWRSVVRPAVATGLLWLGLALFSSVYFATAIVSEHRLYGSIGVIFVLLTWFIAIGAVIMLGAAFGTVWQQRRGRAALADDASGEAAPRVNS